FLSTPGTGVVRQDALTSGRELLEGIPHGADLLARRAFSPRYTFAARAETSGLEWPRCASSDPRVWSFGLAGIAVTIVLLTGCTTGDPSPAGASSTSPTLPHGASTRLGRVWSPSGRASSAGRRLHRRRATAPIRSRWGRSARKSEPSRSSANLVGQVLGRASSGRTSVDARCTACGLDASPATARPPRLRGDSPRAATPSSSWGPDPASLRGSVTHLSTVIHNRGWAEKKWMLLIRDLAATV